MPRPAPDLAAIAPPVCELQLLGVPMLRATGRTIALSAKDAALLALLACEGPLRAERVAALLWPAASAPRADTSLRQRLYRLRREAQAALVDSGAALALRPEVRTDLARALDELARDESAGRGELLGDLAFDELPDFTDWLRIQRRHWRERRAAALATVADRCEKEGALARGIAYTLRQVDDEPLAEHAQRRLMRLHYLRGDRAAAIAAFERFERRLKDELGTRPSAETVELLATIERGGAALPAQRAVAPAALLRPPRLVGREREWQALLGAWAARRVFLVAGEAGIGKSRLVGDLALAEAGVVLVRARPGDAGVADAVLARLLRAVLGVFAVGHSAQRAHDLALVLPELGEPAALVGTAARMALQRAVEASLAQAMALGLRALIVDDLHFADEASLDLLQSLVDCDALDGLCWGVAQRAAEQPSGASRWLSTLAEAQRLQTVALLPLDLAQLTVLIESLALPELDAPHLAPALLRHSGGNPLFALETLRELVLARDAAPPADSRKLPQPASVSALIDRRLQQLSPPALKLARVAALAGGDFSAELAAVVLEQHPLDMAEPWRELEAAQVIRDGGFAHDLILEATRASVPAPIASLLHERIAHHLQAAGSPSARLAPHWAGAGQWLAAGEAYAAAAQQAQSASQRTHEVEYRRLAAEAFERAGERALAFRARCDSVPALIVVQGVAPARALVDTLLAQAGDDAQRAAALLAQAMAALMAGDHAAGTEAAVQASALARTLASPTLALEAACLHAVGLAQAGRAVEALAVIEPCRGHAERESSPRLRGRFWADYAYALNAVRRLRDTAHALQQAIANAQALGDLAELATLTSNLATVKGNLGLVDEALALAHRALALHTELGAIDGPEGGVVHAYVGLYCGMVGRYREALEHLDAALACFARDHQALWTALAANHKAQVLIELGQFARARQALEHEPAPVRSVQARTATMAARVDRALGLRHDAPRLQGALATLGPGDDVHIRMQLVLEIARTTADPWEAMRHCDEVMRLATQLEFAGVALKAGLCRAQAQAAAGQTQEAARAMRTLVEQMASVQPQDLYVGEAWWIAAQVFDANGDGDESLMALARGAQWVRRVALPQVPDAFRDSFLQRNPANRALLAAADRRLAGPAA